MPWKVFVNLRSKIFGIEFTWGQALSGLYLWSLTKLDWSSGIKSIYFGQEKENRMGSVTWKELLIFPSSRGGREVDAHTIQICHRHLCFFQNWLKIYSTAHWLNIHPYKDVITDRHGWVWDSVVNNGFHADGDRISRQDLRWKHSTGVLVQFFRRQRKTPIGYFPFGAGRNRCKTRNKEHSFKR